VPLQDQELFNEEHWRDFESLFSPTTESAIKATAFYRDYLLREGTYLPARDTFIDFRDQNIRRGLSAVAQVAELKRFLGFERWIQHPATCPNPRIRERLVEFSRLDTATAHPVVLVLLSQVDDGSLSHDA